nr:hypothetical protein [Tanacetum cinerariifolium]
MYHISLTVSFWKIRANNGGCSVTRRLPLLATLGSGNPTLSLVAFDVADERKESIQEGLDLLVVLANTRPDLLIDDDLYESERGEQSNDDDLGVGFWQRSFVEGEAVNEKELQAYDIGRDGLVCVARVYGEVGMLL